MTSGMALGAFPAREQALKQRVDNPLFPAARLVVENYEDFELSNEENWPLPDAFIGRHRSHHRPHMALNYGTRIEHTILWTAVSISSSRSPNRYTISPARELPLLQQIFCHQYRL